MRDSDLRRLLLATRNRSILVIEDIDCAVDFPNRLEQQQPGEGKNCGDSQVWFSVSMGWMSLTSTITGLVIDCTF